MKEMQIVVSDDITFAKTGRRVPADETVVLSLDGTERELDLTEEHAKELREFLEPWLAVGHEREPQPQPQRPHAKRAHPGLKTGRERMANLRKWVDENHIRGLSGPDRPAYLTTTGKHYAPDWLLKAYANAMAERGEHDEWIDRWVNG